MMETRELTTNEFSTLTAAINRQITYTVEKMSAAADDKDVNKLRALIADYDTCLALRKLLNPNRIRVVV